MSIDVYRIGLVMNAWGLNRPQLANLQDRLKFIARGLGREYRIHLHVATLRGKPPEDSWPDDLKALGHSTRIELVPVYSERVAAAWLKELKTCDEVWCCPSARETKKGRGRVARVYALAQQDAQVAHHFVWVPTWVGDVGPVGLV